MPAAKIPENEQARLGALRHLKVLDTLAEAEFDALVRVASLTCDVPISLISLVDENRQWFKANIGLEAVKETPRELAFCAHTILGDTLLEVQDATQDPRFSDNPIVLGNPNIRFYAGVPLQLTTGENVGTLCVIDTKPHQLTEHQRTVLTSLAVAASQALESHRLRVAQQAILATESAILEDADYTSSIFQNTKEPIIALLSDGTVTHWNLAAEMLFGFSQSEMVGQNIARLIPEDLISKDAQIIKHIEDLPAGVAYETQRLSKAGELIDVSISLAPLYNRAGRLIGATKIVHDIREESIIKQLLVANEAKYRALSEASPLGVFATDATGACTYTNKRWQEIFGLSYDESLGQGWCHALHPADRDMVYDEWQRTASEHIEFDLEFRIHLPDGSLRFVHSRSRPTLDENDNIIGFVGTVEDITERKKTLDRLAYSEDRLRKLYQSTPAMLQTIDANGRLVSVSDYWLDKHGYTREEVIGRHTSEFHTPESGQYAREVVIPMLLQKGFCENVAYQRVKKNGEVFDVLLSSFLERDSAGNPIRAMSVLVDVTAEKAAKRATDELLNVIRTQFIYSVTDTKGTILDTNDAFCAISQYEREDLIGANHRIVNSGIHPKSFFKDIWATIKSGQVWHGEICNRAKDGSVYWVDSVITPLLDQAGHIDRFISIRTDITERKLSEQALLDQKNRIQQIVDNHNTATFMIDTQHRVTHWNIACELLTGVQAKTVLNQRAWQGFYRSERPTLADLVLNDSRHQAKDFYATSFASSITDKGWHVECWLEELTHGEKRYVFAEASKILDPAGNTVGVLQTITDMTLHKYAEMALIAQKNQIHQILENQSVATFLIDAHHKVTHWNKACAMLTGVAEEAILGQEAWHGFYPQARPCLADMVLNHQEELSEQYYASNRASTLITSGWHAENWFENLGGQKKRYVIFDAAPILNEQGEIIAVIETLQDTTDSKLAETLLSEERQSLASVIEGTQAGTWQWNIATGEAHFNEYWSSILGYTPEEIDTLSESLIKTWSNLVHPDDVEQTILALQTHFKKASTHYEAEFRMRHKSGQWVWILARGRVFTWLNEHQPEWMYGTHVDITALKNQQDALKLANEQIAIATQNGGIGIWSYDLVNKTLECDRSINALYGLAEDDVLTIDRWASKLHPEDREDTMLALEEAIAGNTYDVEFRVIWTDGSVHYIHAKASISRDQDGKALRMLGTHWDVTSLRELSLELVKQHETLRVTLQSIGDAVITTDPKGRVTWLNPVAERMTGWLTSEAKGKPLPQVFNIISEVTRKSVESPVSECLKHGKVLGLANHTILISRDGTEYGIEDSASPIRADNGAIIGAVLVFHDVTEQRRLSNEMSYRATHDQLTGLVNRAEFEARMTQILNRSKADGSAHALMFIDLDQFKLVNDACGHSAGDILLQQVSKMLSEVVRSRDTLARLGGDEFAVILEQCSTEQAQRVAQSICDRMDEYRFIHDGKRFRIGTSIGLSILDGRWPSIANVIQAADAACYTAKEAGRNRVHTWFDTDTSVRTHQGEMQWATRLEVAMDENLFELYAQRIVPVDQAYAAEIESKIYAEILLRLRGPNGDLISPGLFLPAAERFHLASRLDRWVLDHVIQWLTSLPEISIVSTICVNLSGQSIGDRAFHAYAIERLKAAGNAYCRCLCFEITETATVTNMIDASLFIEQVRQLGVKVALDDFGAGASSFGYLKTLKVDILKIDGQFIKDMIHDPLDDSAVRCFVDVAGIVGLRTVAEYVESAEILEHVRSLGIDCAQGFLLHEPQPIYTLLNAPSLQS